jgi:hypothetical protein
MRRGQQGATGRWLPAYLLIWGLVVIAGVTGAAGPTPAGRSRPAVAPRLPNAAPKVVETTPPAVALPAVPPAVAAPADLPVIDYWTSPRGFPPDPSPASTAAVTAGLHPTRALAAYDRPGGRPRAFLPSSIGGLPLVAPIIERRAGWVAVLLPSVNRTIGWLPARGWVARELPDRLELRLRTHELRWIHDGIRAGNWTVAVGTAATPTPLGRTFVLGRTTPRGSVYAGLDAFALGSVPDDRRAVAPGLRRAHTGIHGWYRTDSFGRDSSNGCIRVPKTALRALLKSITVGTPLIVLD